MESEQLLPKRKVLQEELFSGAKARDHPPEQMAKEHKHHGIIAKIGPYWSAFKSLILRTLRVLARHRSPNAQKPDNPARRAAAKPEFTTYGFLLAVFQIERIQLVGSAIDKHQDAIVGCQLEPPSPTEHWAQKRHLTGIGNFLHDAIE